MKLIVFTLLVLNSFSVLGVDWQGHRGARGLFPENTTEAMLEALKYPITTLELDVVVAKDNVVMVSHEPWMSSEICLDLKGNSVKEKAINLYKLTSDEIIKYDCGSKKHDRFPQQKKMKTFKPRLEKLLSETEKVILQKNLQINYNIEIKSTPEDERDGFQPDVAKFTDLVIATIIRKVDPSRVTIQSFDWRVLKYLHKAYPTWKTVALIEESFTPEKVLKDLGFIPTVFSPYFKELTVEKIKFFQKKGVQVIPWTVNEVSDMEKMLKMGVDGIITDYPDRITKVKKSP
ncbi:MAG: glycerophosphodiester phosphodiesterase family protein [Bacteriovoracia bacterium]